MAAALPNANCNRKSKTTMYYGDVFSMFGWTLMGVSWTLGDNRWLEKCTLLKFHHADEETNAMHCWVESWTPKLYLWCIVGGTSVSVINYPEEGAGPGSREQFYKLCEPFVFLEQMKINIGNLVSQNNRSTIWLAGSGAGALSVSYTHLTLPTKRIV